MDKDLAIILTARCDSTRLPGKAMADVGGKPLTAWIIERLKTIGQVVVATTTARADAPLVDLACSMNVPVYQGSTNDVVGRMDMAYRALVPNARYIMRGLGDCPFMAGELITRMVKVMDSQGAEAFQWALAPSCAPVYGAREFPYSRAGWAQVNRRSTSREHVDSNYHTHRDCFKTVLHVPPPNAYFRPYRLEVDWQEDLDLIREIANGVGMLAPLSEIVHFLDGHPEIARLNHDRVERTGLTCYTYDEQREWARNMVGEPVVDWQDGIWYPPSDHAVPIFCSNGRCLIGYVHNGVIHTRVGKIRGDAYLQCGCGAGLRWERKAWDKMASASSAIA